MSDDTLEVRVRDRIEALARLRPGWDGTTIGVVRIGTPPVTVDAMTAWVAGNIRAMVKAIAGRYARAVLARSSLSARFPLGAGPTEGEALRTQARMLDGPTWVAHGVSIPKDLGRTEEDPTITPANGDGVVFLPHSEYWPPAIAPLDVLHALQASEVPEAVLVADYLSDHGIREGSPFQVGKWWTEYPRTSPYPYSGASREATRAAPGYTLERFKDHPVMAQAARWRKFVGDPTDQKVRPMTPTETARWFAGEMEHHWDPHAVAHVLDVVREVREGATAARPIPLSADKESRAAVVVLARAGDEGIAADIVDKVVLRLVWDDRPRPLQMRLRFDRVPEMTVVSGILDELCEDGLRDYLVLHRMAAQQGRTGKIRWTWREHRERTAYAKRVRQSTVQDAEAMADTTTRLRRLARAELRMEYARGGKVEWKRVGPFGLIDIPAGLDADDAGTLERALVQLNPELYRGAAVTREGERYFTLMPDAALCLPGHALRLGTMLAFAYRYRHDHGGIVRMDEPTLFEYASVQHGQVEHVAKARATLKHSLDALVESGVMGGWSVEEGGYTLTPPSWWVDQVVHEVPPELPPPRRNLPKTGKDLRAWRDEQGLSQEGLARVLGVGRQTIARAEGQPDGTLMGTLANALADWKPTS